MRTWLARKLDPEMANKASSFDDIMLDLDDRHWFYNRVPDAYDALAWIVERHQLRQGVAVKPMPLVSGFRDKLEARNLERKKTDQA
jgi:hypothetical protein